MPEKIVWNLNVEAVGSARLTEAGQMSVDFIDKGRVGLAPGASDIAVELLPETEGKVRFLCVTADRYGEGVTYKVGEGADSHALDGPHLLVGRGAVGLLDGVPAKLTFANTLDGPVAVQILVGRDAVSVPTPP